MNVGVVGLGPLGRVITDSYLAAGTHAVFIGARNGLPRALAGRGACDCVSPHLVARRAAIVFVTGADEASFDQALFGGDGLMRGLGPGRLVVAVGPPAPGRAVEARIAASGAAYLEALAGADGRGAPTYAVRGRREVFDRHAADLRALGPGVRFDGPAAPDDGRDRLRGGDAGTGHLHAVPCRMKAGPSRGATTLRPRAPWRRCRCGTPPRARPRS